MPENLNENLDQLLMGNVSESSKEDIEAFSDAMRKAQAQAKKAKKQEKKSKRKDMTIYYIIKTFLLQNKKDELFYAIINALQHNIHVNFVIAILALIYPSIWQEVIYQIEELDDKKPVFDVEERNFAKKLLEDELKLEKNEKELKKIISSKLPEKMKKIIKLWIKNVLFLILPSKGHILDNLYGEEAIEGAYDSIIKLNFICLKKFFHIQGFKVANEDLQNFSNFIFDGMRKQLNKIDEKK